jgi:hypothetical protein
MVQQKQFLSWGVFILVLLGCYVFILFFMEHLAFDLFGIEKKKIHIEKAEEAAQKVAKGADVQIDRASTTILKGESAGDELTGYKRLMVDLYNENRPVFSIAVTLVMAAVGVTLGFIADIVLKILGMDVSKMAHNE